VDDYVTASQRTRPWLIIVGFVVAVALVARLVPVLRGGGLFGLGNSDDGVYYASAIALVHGHLPYRDFLLLHPPGIVVALVPFAALGRIIGEHEGFALARLGWVLLGAVNAAMVSRILRPIGLVGAGLGGLCYAVLYPAVYVEWTTQLQGLGNTLLLAALLLLSMGRATRLGATATLILAGSLLGISATVKIWGVVSVLLVVGWQFFAIGARRAALVLGGAALGATAVCLPFFLAAPGRMWTYVVAVQIGRPRTPSTLTDRLMHILGLRLYLQSAYAQPLLLSTVVIIVFVLVLAWQEERTRIAVVLMLGMTAFLFVVPSWFQHYAALTAPALALAFGSAAQQVANWLARKRRGLGVLGSAAIAVSLVAYASPLTQAAFGRPFAGATVSKVVRSLPGCVAADNQVALIEMDVLGRNLERGCPSVFDVTGYSFALPRTRAEPILQRDDEVWQQWLMNYLQSCDAVVMVNYRPGVHLSSATAKEVESWHELIQVGNARVWSPRPVAMSGQPRPSRERLLCAP
jgi:hypothetical protein